MKVGTEMIGKRVYIRLRVGGSYTGVIQKTTGTETEIQVEDGVVHVQNGMMASLQVLEVKQ